MRGKGFMRMRAGRARRAAAGILTILILMGVMEADAFTLPPSTRIAHDPQDAPEAPRTAVPEGLLGSWSWPVPAPRPVLRGFDLPAPYGPGHRGADIGAAPGTVVTAPADGIVRFAGLVAGRPVLSIEHEHGLVSSFEPVDALVAAGESVLRDEPVAQLSPAIRHAPDGGLHVGARLNSGYLDPVPLFARPPAAVLLPLDDEPPARSRAGAGANSDCAPYPNSDNTAPLKHGDGHQIPRRSQPRQHNSPHVQKQTHPRHPNPG